MTAMIAAAVSAITGKAAIWDDRREVLWWADIQAQRLLATDSDGKTESIFTPSQPGMIALAQSGALILGLENGLWLYSPEMAHWSHLSTVEADRPTVRLNDGKVDGQGRLWFGSMDMTGTGQAIGRLYCRLPTGEVTSIREGIKTPNAIVPTRDGSGLWFTDSPTRIVQFACFSGTGINNLDWRLVTEMPDWMIPDGACEDANGRLWLGTVGRGRVVCLDREGAILEAHHFPTTRLTMTAFGGKKLDRLYVASQRRFLSADELASQPAAGALFSLCTSAVGLPPNRVPGL
jgi:sugar lactone lactonase YvrE